MPTFRLSPRRSKKGKQKEDGSFNFGADGPPKTQSSARHSHDPYQVSNAILNNSDRGHGRHHPSYAYDSYNLTDEDDDDDRTGDLTTTVDNTHNNASTKRFFKSSSRRRARKTNKASQSLRIQDGNSKKDFDDQGSSTNPTPTSSTGATNTGRYSFTMNVNEEEFTAQNTSYKFNRTNSIESYGSANSSDFFSSDYDSDDTGGSKKSLTSLGSLKIGAMNRKKRAAFLKQHIKAQKDKDKGQGEITFGVMNSKNSDAAKAEARRMNMGTSILPSRIDAPSENSLFPSDFGKSTIAPPSNRKDKTSSTPPKNSTAKKGHSNLSPTRSEIEIVKEFTMDPWSPSISYHESDFHFPSDPFAAFDASCTVDVQVEKIPQIPGTPNEKRGHRRDISNSSMNRRVFGFSPGRFESSTSTTNPPIPPMINKDKSKVKGRNPVGLSVGPNLGIRESPDPNEETGVEVELKDLDGALQLSRNSKNNDHSDLSQIKMPVINSVPTHTRDVSEQSSEIALAPQDTSFLRKLSPMRLRKKLSSSPPRDRAGNGDENPPSPSRRSSSPNQFRKLLQTNRDQSLSPIKVTTRRSISPPTQRDLGDSLTNKTSSGIKAPAVFYRSTSAPSDEKEAKLEGSKDEKSEQNSDDEGNPLVHIAEYMDLGEEERLQAYCDLFGVAAETIKDVENKQNQIDSMGKQVDWLMKRVSEMENDKDRLNRQDVETKKEVRRLKGLLSTSMSVSVHSVDGSVSSAPVADPNEVDMLKTELDSKDVIIDALQRSLEEIKKQDKKNASISNGQISKAERDQLVQSHRAELDKVKAQKDAKIKEQSMIISQQKALIFESRQDIQEKKRTIDGLRTEVTELKNSPATSGARVPDNDKLHAELKEANEMIERMKKDHEADLKRISQDRHPVTPHGNPRNQSSEENSSKETDVLEKNSQANTSVVSKSIDVNIPVGTVRARVAMAASRAMKNSAVSIQKPYLLKDHSAQNFTAIRSKSPSGISIEEHEKVLFQLREYGIIIEQMKSDHKAEIMKVMAEKTECEHHLEEIKDKHKVELGKLSGEKIELEHRLENIEKAHERELSKLKEERQVRKFDQKISKEDENKFSELEEGYKAEIEGLLAEKKECLHRLQELEEAHKDEVSKFLAERVEHDRHIEELDETYQQELGKMAAEKKTFEEHIASLEQEIEEMNKAITNAKAQSQGIQGGETTCESDEGVGVNGKQTSEEMEFIRKQNRDLRTKVVTLEEELDTVGGLLEETIMSIKEKDDEIDALRHSPNAGKGVLGVFGGGGQATKPVITNNSQYSDEEVLQLERICKLHQITITRQRVQGKEMFRQLTEAKLLVKSYSTEAKENKEKVEALEKHFFELNQAMDDSSLNSNDNDERLQSSIIKVDATYVTSLKDRTIELQNQIKALRKRNDKLKKEKNVDDVLKAQVDDLTLALEAKTMEIKKMSEVNESDRRGSIKFSSSKDLLKDVDADSDLDDDLTVEDLRQIVAKKDRMIKQLQNKMSHLEQALKTAGPRGAVVNLRKVSLLQEMQDAIVRRLNILISRMDDTRETEEELEEESMSPSKSFMISMSDKLSLLHDYQKISLHLLESKLSNEIESLRSGGKPVEIDEEVEARFERTLESLKKSEEDIEEQLRHFSSELQKHNLQLAAKNGVIKTLLAKDRDRQKTIESFADDIRVYKGLEQFQNINAGIMAKFKECAKLEKELEDKDMIIKRLNNVIEEYRYDRQ